MTEVNTWHAQSPKALPSHSSPVSSFPTSCFRPTYWHYLYGCIHMLLFYTLVPSAWNIHFPLLYMHNGLGAQWKNPKCWKPQSFKRAANKAAPPLPCRDTLSSLFWSENKFALRPVERDTIFPSCLVYKHSWTFSLKQKVCERLCSEVKEQERFVGIVPQRSLCLAYGIKIFHLSVCLVSSLTAEIKWINKCL